MRLDLHGRAPREGVLRAPVLSHSLCSKALLSTERRRRTIGAEVGCATARGQAVRAFPAHAYRHAGNGFSRIGTRTLRRQHADTPLSGELPSNNAAALSRRSLQGTASCLRLNTSTLRQTRGILSAFVDGRLTSTLRVLLVRVTRGVLDESRHVVASSHRHVASESRRAVASSRRRVT